jgi:hypothetical protein
VQRKQSSSYSMPAIAEKKAEMFYPLLAEQLSDHPRERYQITVLIACGARGIKAKRLRVI